MRTILLIASLLVAAAAHANPVLHGTWSAGNVNGRPLVVEFAPGGGGRINGQPMQWQAMGKVLFIQQNGQVGTYGFESKGDKLQVSGGDLNGVAILSRGTAAAEAGLAKQKSAPKSAAGAVAAAGGNGQELVGKWCLMSNFQANAGGGSSRMTCFELRPDGTYFYKHEGSMSANAPGMWGGTSSQSQDAGRWKYNGSQLTAQSQSGKVSTYTLEKRNHPKNRRDPMICLDGQCYVTFYNKPAW